jgi:hypothetical protein
VENPDVVILESSQVASFMQAETISAPGVENVEIFSILYCKRISLKKKKSKILKVPMK